VLLQDINGCQRSRGRTGKELSQDRCQGAIGNGRPVVLLVLLGLRQRGEVVQLADERDVVRGTRDDGLVEGDAGNAVGPCGHGRREVLGFNGVIEQIEPGDRHFGLELVGGPLGPD
jgi:hypothetical protein